MLAIVDHRRDGFNASWYQLVSHHDTNFFPFLSFCSALLLGICCLAFSGTRFSTFNAGKRFLFCSRFMMSSLGRFLRHLPDPTKVTPRRAVPPVYS